jgi:RHS repeat-associated protein
LALDGLGSVRAELADNGPLLKSFRYAAYGTLVGASSGLPSLLGYTGELTDASGLVYLRARWYDPGTGRFATRDPMGGTSLVPPSLNGFGYVSGNPIGRTDPSGMCQDPGGSGVRYCISRWIPTRFICPNIFCGVGDNRIDPSPIGGDYRVQQLIRSDGSVRVDVAESALGLFGWPRARGTYHDCGASITGSGLLSTCVATNGFRSVPVFGGWAPDDILWAVSISGTSIAVRGTRYPSMEIYRYGAASTPEQLYFFDAMATSPADLGHWAPMGGSGEGK